MGNVKLKTLTKPLYWAPQSSPLLCHCKNRKIWDCCEILNKLVYRQELLGCSKICRCWWQMTELVRFLCSLVSWSAWSVELTSMECGADQHGVWSWPAWSVELTSMERGADQSWAVWSADEYGAWSSNTGNTNALVLDGPLCSVWRKHSVHHHPYHLLFTVYCIVQCTLCSVYQYFKGNKECTVREKFIDLQCIFRGERGW